MRLYAGMSTEFVRETTHNRIADRLAGAFFGYYDVVLEACSYLHNHNVRAGDAPERGAHLYVQRVSDGVIETDAGS